VIDIDFTARAAMAFDVYNKVSDEWPLNEWGCLGADLAYLMGAILRGNGKVELESHHRLVHILREHYKPDWPVWQYVNLVQS
jgi:hypothetical protein